jgi:IS605 OrfB family transposase
MILLRTIKVKLKMKPEEILPTVEACTKAFNYVCQIGYDDKDFNSVSLHHKTYRYVREAFELPSDMAVQMRMKSAEALKSAIECNGKCPQSKQVSVRYSHNGYSHNGYSHNGYSHNGYNVWFDRQELSILTIDGRIKVPFHFPKWFEQYVSWRRRSAELIVQKDKIYLCIVFQKEVEDPKPVDNPIVIGIDRGINKVAVCSNNRFFKERILYTANKYQRLRRRLQKCGSKSAKRHLRKIAKKENRFRRDVNHRDVNHCITKKIVEMLPENSPENSIVVLEDLKKIRQRARANKRGRAKLHSWPFHQFETFRTYKANARRIQVDYVDARYTSQKCSQCGHTSKSNREYQAIFKCTQCSFSLNADLNAARNIERNYRDAKGYPEGLSVNQPIVGAEEAKAILSN